MVIAYSSELTDGGSLPSCITFSPSQLSLSIFGCVEAKSYEVKIVAQIPNTDWEINKEQTFKVFVQERVNRPPVWARSIEDQEVMKGETLEVFLPSFWDPD